MAAATTTPRSSVRSSARRPNGPSPEVRVKKLESEVEQLRGVAQALAGELVKSKRSSRGTQVLKIYKSLMSRRSRGASKTSPASVKMLASILRDAETKGTAADTDPVPPRSKKVAVRKTPAVSSSGVDGALVRGEAAKAGWVRDGVVIPAKELGLAWDMTPQGLGRAADRGELFALKVNNRLYYPACFVALDRETVAAVTSALGELSPAEKLVFWLRTHGSLGGKTVAAALEHSSNLTRVVQLASAWAQEAGAVRVAA
jgi:hypothetical protein